MKSTFAYITDAACIKLTRWHEIDGKKVMTDYSKSSTRKIKWLVKPFVENRLPMNLTFANTSPVE